MWQKAIDILTNTERIIEFGCGSGQFAKLCFKNKKSYVLGIDFSREAINIACRINKKHMDKFVVKNLLKLNKLPEYNTIICFETLEHITDDLAVIAKIKPESRVLFSVPNYESLAHVRKFRFTSDIVKRYSDVL